MQTSNILPSQTMVLENYLSNLRKNSPRSFYLGLVSFSAVLVFLVLSGLDSRTVMGINTWIKPIKFGVSIGIFLWTMGLYLPLLEEFPKFRRRIENYFLISMIVELVMITIQAARGVQSHFNETTALDGAIYGVMGMFIFPMIPVSIWMDQKFKQLQDRLDHRLLLSIRFSLWIFAIASIIGAVMSARLAHSVGVPDGGPGIPLVNWSRAGGDIRIAHFAGIHALQILPLFAWFGIQKNWGGLSVKIVSTGYGLLVAAVFLHAMSGRPLF